MVFENPTDDDKQENPWDTFLGEIKAEIDVAQGAINEVDVKLQQSQAEASKLADRNAAITARLQKAQSQADALLPLDVREAYDAALEAQQRLFLMRGQVERLNSDKKHLADMKTSLEKVAAMVEGAELPQAGPSQEAFSIVEAIIQAQESERQRLSRQMHDGPAQALSNFILQSEIAMRLFDVDLDKAREELTALKVAATSAFQQVRNFVFELRPMMLDDLGLVPTLKRYVEAFKEQTENQVELTISGLERRMESYIEVIIFRSIQELLGFAHRQGQATQIKIDVTLGDANIKVSIEDNGKGFDEEELFRGSGISIKAIKDRIEMLGGEMEVESIPDRGGYFTFQIPVGGSNQAVFTEL